MLLKLCLIGLLGLMVVVNASSSCNEAVCGAIVSKCLLTQSCKCDRKEGCFCCKDCLNCLGYLYTDCCSCVDMCPEQNDTTSRISKISYLEDLELPVPSLFDALVEKPDVENRWNSTTFVMKIGIDASTGEPKKGVNIHMEMVDASTINGTDVNIEENVHKQVYTMNCTVAYWSQCMSMDKCGHSCRTMGSNAFRWFHDGCCQCIGDRCMNQGVNESRCPSCPMKEIEEIDEDESLFNYGEDEDD